MLKFAKKVNHNAKARYCGIHFNSRTLSVSVVDKQDDGLHLLECFHTDYTNDATFMTELKALVERHNLQNHTCTWILDQEQYQFLQVDKPDVAEEELHSAIRWKIKDLCDIPLDNLSFDVFPIPPHGPGGHRNFVGVIAAAKDFLSHYRDLFKECQLELSTIDCQALALKNIANLQPYEGTTSLLYLSHFGSQVLILNQQQLYVAHQIRVPMMHFDRDAKRIQEALSTELLRIYEYVYAQLSLGSSKQIFLLSSLHIENEFVNGLKDTLEKQVICVDINKTLHDVDDNITHNIIGLAGLLRDKAESLHATD